MNNEKNKTKNVSKQVSPSNKEGKISELKVKKIKFHESGSILIDLKDIRIGYNPRLGLGDLTSLKQSILQHGLLEPILIRPKRKKQDNKTYETVCGNRRYYVFKELGYLQIQCIIIKLTDEEAFHIALIDNKERDDLNPIEEATHYHIAQKKYKLSSRQMAEKYGKDGKGESYKYYQRKLILLELPKEVQNQVGTSMSQISETHCIHICKLLNRKDLIKRFEALFNQPQDKWMPDQEERLKKELKRRQDIQISLGKRIISDDLTVRQTERQVKGLLKDIEEWNQQLDKEIEEEKKKQQLLDGIYFKDASNMKEIKTDSIDLVCTSPPYLTGQEYEKNKTFEQHIKDLKKVLSECARVVCPGGKIVYNVADIITFSRHNSEGWPEERSFVDEIVKHLRKENFVLFARIIWKKDFAWNNNKHVRFNSKHTEYRVLPSWEYILIFKNMNGKPKQRSHTDELISKLSKDEWKKDDGYACGVWYIPSVHANKDGIPMFPDEIARRIIEMYSYKGDKVLDPYLGTGTTAKVARELGREAFGYEINEKYRSIILNKLQEKSDKKKKTGDIKDNS